MIVDFCMILLFLILGDSLLALYDSVINRFAVINFNA